MVICKFYTVYSKVKVKYDHKIFLDSALSDHDTEFKQNSLTAGLDMTTNDDKMINSTLPTKSRYKSLVTPEHFPVKAFGTLAKAGHVNHVTRM